MKETNAKRTSRSIAIDSLRTLSIIFVVAIHTSGDYVMQYSSFDTNFFYTLALHSIVRMGVPLFVLLSGAFVLGRAPYVWRDFYLQRLPRLLIPLVIWLPLYYLWIWLKGDDIVALAAGLWRGEGYLHFWFLMMLIVLYLLTPLLDEILLRLPHRREVFTLGFGLLGLGVVAYAYDTYQGSSPFFPLYYLYFAGYYVLGYAFRKFPLQRTMGAMVCYLLCLPIICWTTYYCERMGWGDYPLDNLSPLIALGSVNLFALAASEPFKILRPNLLSRISPYVMGIYIVHIALLNVVTKPFLMFTPELMQIAWINVPIRITLVVLLSLGAVLLLRHIPYIKNTIR